MRARQLTSGAAISLIVGILSCVGVADTGRAAELIPLRANYSAVSGAFAPLWLAQEKGIYTKYGLAVDLKYVLDSTATQALLSRSLDIVNASGGIVDAGLSGARVVFIAGILNRIVFSLYSKPDLRGLSDLRGKVLGVTQPGSTTDFAARILIQESGMVPGKDVRILYLKGMPEIITALSQGTVDAGIVSAPTTVKARQAGFKELLDITGRNIPMIHAALATTRDFVKEHPDQVRRYLQAYLEGLKIARTDPELTKQMISKYTRMTNAEDLEETYQTFLKAWEKLPYVPPAAVQTLLNFATHPTAKTASPGQFIDNSILAELDRSGFIEGLYRK